MSCEQTILVHSTYEWAQCVRHSYAMRVALFLVWPLSIASQLTTLTNLYKDQPFNRNGSVTDDKETCYGFIFTHNNIDCPKFVDSPHCQMGIFAWLRKRITRLGNGNFPKNGPNLWNRKTFCTSTWTGGRKKKEPTQIRGNEYDKKTMWTSLWHTPSYLRNGKSSRRKQKKKNVENLTVKKPSSFQCRFILTLCEENVCHNHHHHHRRRRRPITRRKTSFMRSNVACVAPVFPFSHHQNLCANWVSMLASQHRIKKKQHPKNTAYTHLKLLPHNTTWQWYIYLWI